MDVLKKNIQRLLKKHNLTTAAAEKKAGLSVSTLHHILSGKAKHPQLETIVALAEMFSCSLDEIVLYKPEKPNAPVFLNTKKLSKKIDYTFLKVVIGELQKVSEGKKISPPEAMQIVLEVYYYFLDKKIPIDSDFIELTIDKYIKKTE